MTASAPNGTAARSQASAISQAWDAVVHDYKIFHGVRARGGTVDDLPAHLREPPETAGSLDGKGPDNMSDAKPETDTPPSGSSGGGGLSKQKLKVEDAAPETAATDGKNDGDDNDKDDNNNRDDGLGLSGTPRASLPSAMANNEPSAPSLMPPQTILASMNGDENLKKLLMSWYYAGYYTGLYEGQQQQQQQQTGQTDKSGQTAADQPEGGEGDQP